MARRRLAAGGLALVIGAMAVVAGGRVVLLGARPDYPVIGWLPVYNLVMGVLTVGVTAVLILRSNRLARPMAYATLAAHGLVLAGLLVLWQDVVARESLVAMVVRVVTWLAIAALLGSGHQAPLAAQRSSR